MRVKTHFTFPHFEREVLEQTIATARAALNEQTFAQEWEAGLLLGHDEAIDEALAEITKNNIIAVNASGNAPQSRI
jgi:hypothetical protein